MGAFADNSLKCILKENIVYDRQIPSVFATKNFHLTGENSKCISNEKLHMEENISKCILNKNVYCWQ